MIYSVKKVQYILTASAVFAALLSFTGNYTQAHGLENHDTTGTVSDIQFKDDQNPSPTSTSHDEFSGSDLAQIIIFGLGFIAVIIVLSQKKYNKKK